MQKVPLTQIIAVNTDLYFFNLINGLAGKQKWLDYFGVFLAKYLAHVLLPALFIFALAFENINMFVLPILAGLFSRFIANEIIYFFYKRKRPPDVMSVKNLIKTPKHPSFPSGHASFFFALSFSLLRFNIGLGIAFVALSFLISFSRIFAGVHWPSDILAGIGAGLLSYFLFLWALSNL